MKVGNDQVILDEDIFENYEPTEEELYEYGSVIGTDLKKEPHLMWIAREGIKASLPEDWRPCQTPTGDVYYFNFSTEESVWDHPCDELYKAMVVEERKKFAAKKSMGARGNKIIKIKEDKKKKGNSYNDELRPLTKAPGQKLKESDPDSDEVNVRAKEETESDSDDYNKEVNSGLDKRLSEKPKEFENLEPALRGSLKKDLGFDKNLSQKPKEFENLEPVLRDPLEKDFEGTLSLKSTATGTARDESPLGKAPIDIEAEKKQRADIAATSSDEPTTVKSFFLRICSSFCCVISCVIKIDVNK